MSQTAFLLFALTAFATTAIADDPSPSPGETTVAEGSAPVHRTQVDSNGGQTYIYVGGSFPSGTQPGRFEFLFDFPSADGSTSGYITPLLFERVAGELYTTYVIRGIGRSFTVNISSAPQTLPFEILEGTTVTPSGNYTFGFANALVNSSGQQIVGSAGAVDMDNPADSGAGVGGPGTTNHWSVTNVGDPPAQGPPSALGTSFGAPGSGADWTFYGSFRTYSMQAFGVIASATNQ
jgi:hypothetical protein